MQNFLAVPVIGASFLLASIVFSATCSGFAVESVAYVSHKMQDLLCNLSGMLISLPSKLHSICREKTGQEIELSTL